MDWFFFVFFVIFLVIAIQPVLAQRALRHSRRVKIQQIEGETGSRVITLIHRQERVSLFGFSSARYIDIDDAQAVLHAIRTTPDSQPISLILHTPGGLVLAAMQIARAVQAHPAKVTAYVPIFAMSGGTLIALAADEIVMGEFSLMGPIDPQIAGLPGPSIVRVREQKSLDQIHDLTLVLADVSEKAITQLRKGAADLMASRLGQGRALEIAERLTGGYFTHDYAIYADEARSLGLSVSTALPETVMELITLYPQPVRQQAAVEYLPPSRDLDRPDEKPTVTFY